MKAIKACRICLTMDVKMFSLQAPLENDLKIVIGENIQFLAPMLSYACYECAYLLKKYVKFREKCLIAQSILCELVRINSELSEYEIMSIDRKKTKLASHLALSIPQSEIQEFEIKEEDITLDMSVEEDGQCVDAVSNNHYQVSNIQYMVSNYSNLVSVDDGKGDVKNVYNGIDLMVSDDMEDDVPLKFLNGVKPIKKPKRRKTLKNPKLRKCKAKSEKNVKKLPPKSGKRKPVNEDGLTENEVALLKDFDVTKFTLDQQIQEIVKRKETPNYKDSPYKCEYCYKGFLQEETLNNHAVRHDPSAGDIECVVCHSRFALRRAFRLHAARHAKRYACRSCAFVTVHVDQAKKHKLWHEGVLYKCEHCNEISTKLTSYLSHVRMKHPSQWVCSICGYSFVSEKGMRMHASRMHREALVQQEDNSKSGGKEPETSEQSNLYCQDCDVRFATEAALKRHIVTSVKHRNVLGNGCRHCGETFPSRQQLRDHQRVHAVNLRARNLVARRRYIPRGGEGGNSLKITYPVRCEHCDEMIANRREHWIHYQRSHQDKKYPLSESRYICEICGKGFKANAFLVYHSRTHSSERAYVCAHAHCGGAFHTRAALAAHARTHTRARPHVCAQCRKGFSTKCRLQHHMKRHSGARPFPCAHCSKAFTQSSHLNMHIRNVHTGEHAGNECAESDYNEK